MYQLMCWCWSELPQHRPTFTQIKRIVSTHSFTQLLGTTKLTTDDDTFRAACIQTVQVTKSKNSNYPEKRLSGSGTPSKAVLNFLSSQSSCDEDSELLVWFGTEKGKVGFMQFLAMETSNEVCNSFLHLI